MLVSAAGQEVAELALKEQQKQEKALQRRQASEALAQKMGKPGKHMQPSEIAMGHGVSTRITCMSVTDCIVVVYVNEVCFSVAVPRSEPEIGQGRPPGILSCLQRAVQAGHVRRPRQNKDAQGQVSE